MGGALTGAGGVHRSAPCERIGTAVSPGGTAGCKWHHTRGCGLRSQVGTTPEGVGDPRATEAAPGCAPRTIVGTEARAGRATRTRVLIFIGLSRPYYQKVV